MAVTRRRLASVVQIWGKHRVSRVAAALAFYAVFTVAPVTVLVLLITRAVVGPQRALQTIEDELAPLIGSKGTQGVDMLVRASQHQARAIPLALAAFVFIVATIAIFVQVQEALDDIWGIAEGERGGVVAVIGLRLHVLVVVVAIGLLAVVALFVGIMAGRAAGFAVNVAAVFAFLLLAYRMLPNERVGWRSCLIGALATTVILLAGEAAMSFYFTHFHPETAYGTAGSFVVLLLWIYYSTQLFLFGAVLTRVLETKT